MTITNLNYCSIAIHASNAAQDANAVYWMESESGRGERCEHLRQSVFEGLRTAAAVLGCELVKIDADEPTHDPDFRYPRPEPIDYGESE